MTEGEVHEVNIVLKADIRLSGSDLDSLLKLSTDEVKVKIIGSGVGGITETDATLAAASNAILVGFNVRADASARKVIEAESLDLRLLFVIYNLIDEVKAAMSGMLSPELKQQIIGLAEVRDVFKSPESGAIAGCIVTEGVVKRRDRIRVSASDNAGLSTKASWSPCAASKMTLTKSVTVWNVVSALRTTTTSALAM